MALGSERRRSLIARKPPPTEKRRLEQQWVKACKDQVRSTVARMGAAAQRPPATTFSGRMDDRLLAHVEAAAQLATGPGQRRGGPRPNGGLNGVAFNGDQPRVIDPTSESRFNAVTKINRFRATVKVQRSLEELAPMMDPRGWDLGNGVVDKAYRVYEDEWGEYQPVPAEDDPVPLGENWTKGLDRPWLIFEFAKTDAASFENILEIVQFKVNLEKEILVRYRLYESLKCMIGFFALDGGLHLNEGFCKATPQDDGWSRIEIVKRVRARDLTPDDPGDGFDFGQWINATIGVALSLWVDDIAKLTPFS